MFRFIERLIAGPWSSELVPLLVYVSFRAFWKRRGKANGEWSPTANLR